MSEYYRIRSKRDILDLLVAGILFSAGIIGIVNTLNKTDPPAGELLGLLTSIVLIIGGIWYVYTMILQKIQRLGIQLTIKQAE